MNLYELGESVVQKYALLFFSCCVLKCVYMLIAEMDPDIKKMLRKAATQLFSSSVNLQILFPLNRFEFKMNTKLWQIPTIITHSSRLSFWMSFCPNQQFKTQIFSFNYHLWQRKVSKFSHFRSWSKCLYKYISSCFSSKSDVSKSLPHRITFAQ